MLDVYFLGIHLGTALDWDFEEGNDWPIKIFEEFKTASSLKDCDCLEIDIESGEFRLHQQDLPGAATDQISYTSVKITDFIIENRELTRKRKQEILNLQNDRLTKEEFEERLKQSVEDWKEIFQDCKKDV